MKASSVREIEDLGFGGVRAVQAPLRLGELVGQHLLLERLRLIGLDGRLAQEFEILDGLAANS